MKILVFGGSGKMGAAVAFDLAREPDVTAIGLVGRRMDALEKATRLAQGARSVVLHQLDVEQKDEVVALHEAVRRRRQHAARSAHELPRSSTPPSSAAATSSTCWRSTTGDPTHTRPRASQLPAGMTLDEYGDWIHETALKNGVTLHGRHRVRAGPEQYHVRRGYPEAGRRRVGHRPRRRASRARRRPPATRCAT